MEELDDESFNSIGHVWTPEKLAEVKAFIKKKNSERTIWQRIYTQYLCWKFRFQDWIEKIEHTLIG